MLIADRRTSDGADGSNPGPQGLGARTRDRVRKTIAEDGPLTAAGHARRDSDYNGVATSALRSLAEHAGTDAVDAFARERSAELEARYALQLAAAGQDVTARAQALSTALTADGFAASTRPVGAGTPLAGVQLCQGHCPVQQIAAEFPQLCEAETQAFSRLLGVHVQRLSTLASGGHVCTTNIPTTGTNLNSGTTLAGRTT